MSTTYTLAATTRDAAAKPRDVRSSTPKRVTAEFYGAGKENRQISLDYQEFRRILRDAGESSVIDLTIDEKDTEKVLVHDVQYHPITDEFLHVDFLNVDMNKPVTTHVPLSFTGESVAVKQLGGLLMHLKDSIEIRCLPADLPHDIQVDVSTLENFGDSIQVADLTLDREKLEVLVADDVAVCNVQAPKTAEEVEADLAEPVGEAVSEEDKKEQAEQEAAAEAGKEDSEGKGDK